MKTIEKIVKTYVEYGREFLEFAEFYYEHNGKKFRVHYEGTTSIACASIGQDWYESLSVMTKDGTWQQVADAKIVGAVGHAKLWHTEMEKVIPLLDDAEKKFKAYIKKIWS